MATLTNPNPSFVNAQIRYLNSEWKDAGEVPAIGDRDSRRANTSKVEVLIEDARPRHEAGVLDLDTNGFVLARNQSAVTSFQDDAEIESVYYPEIEALMRELTGADHLFISQHVVRTEDKSDFNKAYARFLHSDYSIENPRAAAAQYLANRQAPLDSAKLRVDEWEFAWFNTWQPFDRAVEQNPLTILDAESLARSDLIDYRYTGFRDDGGTSSMPIRNPNHRFYYFP
ncbi:MAG: CmcJ/NvfI family oxidoreductase, partial [Gammaproteobacteria bacterium]|nr:CmcJ/NvfI family oxidoreductase [Gammaproteobacteria bacterium]